MGTNCDVQKVTADPGENFVFFRLISVRSNSVVLGCPLNCSPGYCVRAGTGQNTYACMCNGTLTPENCRQK